MVACWGAVDQRSKCLTIARYVHDYDRDVPAQCQADTAAAGHASLQQCTIPGFRQQPQAATCTERSRHAGCYREVFYWRTLSSLAGICIGSTVALRRVADLCLQTPPPAATHKSVPLRQWLSRKQIMDGHWTEKQLAMV